LDLGGLVGNSSFIFVRGFDLGAPAPVGARISFHGNLDAEEFLLGTVELSVRTLGGPMALSAERANTLFAPAALYVQDGKSTSVYPWDVPVQGTDSGAAPLQVSMAPEPLFGPMLLFLLPALRMPGRRVGGCAVKTGGI
jgi:hypothetical protein